MAEREVIIIGAGIGGLAAGIYAQLNGYQARIFEMHNIAGGVCTGWKRKGYTFDGCMHHLVGCDPKTHLHALWRELGALPETIYYPDDLISIENTEGKRFTVHTDLDRLEQHLLELSPRDSEVIEEFMAAVRKFANFSMMDMLAAPPLEMALLLPYLGLIGKWGKVTLEQVAARFSDPFLQRAMGMLQYDFANIPAVIALAFISGCATRNFGWPAGGSLAFAGAMEKRFRDLGGDIQYRSKVTDILVDNHKAVGIKLENGTEIRPPQQTLAAVISNADGYTSLYKMLNGAYLPERVRDYYENSPAEQEMALHVSFGIARTFEEEPHALVLWLPEPVEIAGKLRDRLFIEYFNYAPEMSPEGKTTIQVLMSCSYDYWCNLDRDDYKAEKTHVAETIINCLERRYPGIREQVEVIDVATPLTTERYTGSFQGFQAWPVPNQTTIEALSGKGLSRTLPGLDQFYMVGQWAGGLGLPNVAMMGRNIIKDICKRDRRRFVTR